jgi:3-hydroxyisobutyrate dehydrogenase-like beta-hydroxyacid dehydrogenase
MAAFGAKLDRAGIAYLDATVGGSSRQVRRGEAIVMAGGRAQAFRVCEDLFASFAQRMFHVGEWGAGARMKLVLNLALGLNRAVLAEALSFARAIGIAPRGALEVLEAGPAYSRVMEIKGKKMLNGEFSPEARLSQHLKDVNLILDLADKSGAHTPLSRIHRELLERAEAAGFGDEDNSAIIKAFE